MRYLIAPNAFKGTIDAGEAARIIAEEIGRFSGNKCLLQPLADGGDGTCSLLIDSLKLEKIQILTLNAIGQPVLGYFGWDSSTKKAYLDVSSASGIGSLESWQKDPKTASTFGTGLAIRKALDLGAEEVILGLGGSATVDLGIGILSALGVLFLDESGRELSVFSPNFLEKIKHIQITPHIPKVRFTCLCDVRNPFLGENGAVLVFGPQKGLRLNEIQTFGNSCNTVLDYMIKKSKKDWIDKPGYGAAGGIAMGLDFFFPTEIQFGAEYFFGLVDIGRKVENTDWIITGEGQYDSQSNQGKASFELLQRSKRAGKKIALITSGEGGRNAGFDLVLELPELDFSAVDYIEKARQNLGRLIKMAILEGKFS
jgi:glycerate kinase